LHCHCCCSPRSPQRRLLDHKPTRLCPHPKLRARFFAPFVSGPEGQRLLAELVRAVASEAKGRGYVALICNMEQVRASR
jgi:hypothetical protein